MEYSTKDDSANAMCVTMDGETVSFFLNPLTGKLSVSASSMSSGKLPGGNMVRNKKRSQSQTSASSANASKALMERVRLAGLGFGM